ncbi:hypothetical protein Tco_0210427 [Tanacetum coccineum]
MLAEFIKNRKKQLAVERAEAIRSKPPTKSRLRNLMMTYLKNTCRFTHAQLKHRDFEEIQGLYNKEKELVDTFIPIGYEEDERRIKDLNTKAEEERSNKDVDNTNKRKKRIRMKRTSKKKNTDADLKEEEQLKKFLSIVPNEEEAINYETMFEANAVDELWKNQEDWVLKSWNLYENCGVHILMLEDGTEFHMLAERKYPLTKETLKKMLVLRLTAESESEAAFDLLRFIQKQIDEM